MRMRILLAEDHAFARKLAEAVVLAGGHEVVLAVNGREVVQELDQSDETFDLIVLDIRMPEMDGFEVAREIRARGLECIPIVALTANPDDEGPCLRAGMNACYGKPLTADRLSAILDRWCPGEGQVHGDT